MRIDKSTRKNKKYMIEYKGKTIHFGQDGASDYTIHKDPKRKEAYINRHKQILFKYSMQNPEYIKFFEDRLKL